MKSEEKKSANQQDLAEQRTLWAWDRTVLAKERTFAGWVRTGLATIAVGLGSLELLRNVHPRWLVEVLSVALIVLGGLINVLAFWRYRSFGALDEETLVQRSRDVEMMPLWWIGVITAVLVACAALALVLVFL